MERSESPQSKAYLWLVNNISNQTSTHKDLPTYLWLVNNINNQTSTHKDLPKWRLIQRFALATIYSSLRGDHWVQHHEWLDWETNECNWEQIDYIQDFSSCNERGEIKALAFENANNLDGSIPPEISLLGHSLQLVIFRQHKELTGVIPTEIGQLTKLTKLTISATSIVGTLPTKFGTLQSLETLQIHLNKIDGKIPSEVGKVGNLSELSFLSSDITGLVPAELGKLTELTSLILADWKIIGTIPIELGNLVGLKSLRLNLSDLALGSNRLKGTLLFDFFSKLTRLRHVYINDNQISGSISRQVGLASSLIRLELQNTKLSGPMPTELLALDNLTSLVVTSTSLSRSIPAELCEKMYKHKWNCLELQLKGHNHKGTNTATITMLRRGPAARRRRRAAPDRPQEEPGDHQNVTAPLEAGGSCLNLDLCMGAATVLERLRRVNSAIMSVSLEVNLMSELIFDQEWMAIMESMGSLPSIRTVSLSFRIRIPIPTQAFTKLIELATPMEQLNLVGLQLSHTIIRTTTSSTTSEEGEVSPVNELIRACQNAKTLTRIHLCRYRPVPLYSTAASGHVRLADPLLLALSNLPNCQLFHLERTNVFTNPQHNNNNPDLLDLICRSPFSKLKIGLQDRAIQLQQPIPKMAVAFQHNPRLKELIIQHTIDQPALEAISELLRTNQTLEKLSLLRIQCDNWSTVLQNHALEHNTTLQSLELSIILSRADRSLLKTNWSNLAMSLSHHNSRLTTLHVDLAGARHGSGLATEPLLKMLREDNFVLQNIVINRNTVPLHPDILFYLKLNKIGRNKLLRQQAVASETELVANSNKGSLRDDWIQTLIKHKSNVRILHYFICRDPSIIIPLTLSATTC
ncbi:Leucine rich repeat N-terminal domain [Seminavis robusta]|uniref:Leucine rich repeat N-terminal domain n=1 Tax=Seminavis robusta TaxID=568900 RepID=A0A9N8HSK5_9STRA|nr:Leucine rich repeat N-terminal domain [Seminavis robusta]|eukprot:Sro1534_g280430.1 Leucine rich repeat N-terminal domain (862) ;mRNA; f:2938-6333